MRLRQDAPSLAAIPETALRPLDAEPDGEVFDVARNPAASRERAILAEVGAVAQANKMSVSLVVNLLLDSYLNGQGRAGHAELAPWYPDYALRKKPNVE